MKVISLTNSHMEIELELDLSSLKLLKIFHEYCITSNLIEENKMFNLKVRIFYFEKILIGINPTEAKNETSKIFSITKNKVQRIINYTKFL